MPPSLRLLLTSARDLQCLIYSEKERSKRKKKRKKKKRSEGLLLRGVPVAPASVSGMQTGFLCLVAGLSHKTDAAARHCCSQHTPELPALGPRLATPVS